MDDELTFMSIPRALAKIYGIPGIDIAPDGLLPCFTLQRAAKTHS